MNYTKEEFINESNKTLENFIAEKDKAIEHLERIIDFQDTQISRLKNEISEIFSKSIKLVIFSYNGQIQTIWSDNHDHSIAIAIIDDGKDYTLNSAQKEEQNDLSDKLCDDSRFQEIVPLQSDNITNLRCMLGMSNNNDA
jgi:hypothetical protein